VRPLRYHLGAEELIELGADNRVMLKNRRPFLAGRTFKLGQPAEESILDMLAAAGKWVADTLSYALHVLGSIIDVPAAWLAQGAEVAFNAVSDLLKKVPVLGNLLAEILLLGGALIKFGLSLPGMALQGLSNLLAGLARALDGQSEKAANQEKLDTARNRVLELAPSELKDRVMKLLAAIGISGDNLTPDILPNGQPTSSPAGTSTLSGASPPPVSESGGLRNVLAVGVPVLGVVALAAAMTGK
jgi:hypothetical protein